MSNDRSAMAPGSECDVSIGNAWTRFWFTPIPTTGMKCLRLLSGLVFFGWLLSFVGHQAEFFSWNGWFDLQAVREVQREPNLSPAPIGWSMLYLAGENAGIFQAMYWGSLAVLALFTLGIATRITGVLTWVIVVSFLGNPATSYEGDYLLGILAFYQMIGHLLVGQWSGNLTPVERLLGSRRDFAFSAWLFPNSQGERAASHGANLMTRLLQIHVAIIIATMGLHKLQIADWWAGVALWYPLHPTFKTTLESLKRGAPSAASSLFVLSIIQYAVLAWLLCFPFFAWRTGWWRGLLVGGGLIIWAGAFFVFRLPLFGPFVLLGCLSFLRPNEWAWAMERIGSVVGRSVSRKGAEPKKMAVVAGKDTNIKK